LAGRCCNAFAEGEVPRNGSPRPESGRGCQLFDRDGRGLRHVSKECSRSEGVESGNQKYRGMAEVSSAATSISKRRTADVEEACSQATAGILTRSKTMNRRTLAKVASLSFALILGLIAMKQGQAQDAKTPYSSMAPVDQYLMADRNAEITLARSAAPDAISADAKILVLGRQGYETAVEGKKGFGWG